jgi:D-alanyl-D-alanine dipeptidase
MFKSDIPTEELTDTHKKTAWNARGKSYFCFLIVLFLMAVAIVLVVMALVNSAEQKNSLPQGFVYLKDVDPTIIQSVRYSGSENFVARPVQGYKSETIIFSQAAAIALKNVQTALRSEGFSLVVYDAYRPQQAVDSFIAWSQDLSDQANKALYYPTVNKADVFKLGYVAKKSGHTRGSTVDLSMISLNNSFHSVKVSHRPLQNGEIIPFLDDGTLDMGSSFDLFHEVSHHDTPLVGSKATEQRNHLRNVMKQYGFKEYSEEWWHYTLKNEPFPDTYFDFPVQ